MLKRVSLLMLICVLVGAYVAFPVTGYASKEKNANSKSAGFFLSPTFTRTNTYAPGTPTPTMCPFPTQEPIWVEPVTSPTNLTTQIIYINPGNNAEKVEVISESGTFEDTTAPYEVEIPLLANTTHNLLVKSYIKQMNNNGCIYGGYVMGTTTDKNGAPLTIVQVSGSVTPTATICPMPTQEPLWVDPVTSPTNLNSQTIHVYAGSNAEKVEVISESGTFEDTLAPYDIEISLLANTTHHLTVKSYIKQTNSGGCIFGGYTLTTTLDKFGEPLTIVQTACQIQASAPSLVSPSHRFHTTNTRPNFSWGTSNNAESYRLLIYNEDRSFEFKKRVFGTNHTPATALSKGKYLWRVRTQDNTCRTWTGWSGRHTLFID